MSLLQTSIYKYVLDLYCTEACLTGFRGAHRDANMRMPDVQPMHADAEHGRMKNFLNRGRMLLPWRRRLASLWIDLYGLVLTQYKLVLYSI